MALFWLRGWSGVCRNFSILFFYPPTFMASPETQGSHSRIPGLVCLRQSAVHFPRALISFSLPMEGCRPAVWTFSAVIVLSLSSFYTTCHELHTARLPFVQVKRFLGICLWEGEGRGGGGYGTLQAPSRQIVPPLPPCPQRSLDSTPAWPPLQARLGKRQNLFSVT